MKQIFFILAVIFLLASCDKDKCTYTLGEREYNLIPYAANDTITATFYGKNDEPTVEKLIVGEGELFVINNKGAFGKPLLCDGTFDYYQLYISSVDEGGIIEKCKLHLTTQGGAFGFVLYFDMDNNNNIGIVIDSPFDTLKNPDVEKDFEFYPSINIDKTTFNDVYFISGDSDTLYYSTQTGLIKLIYPDGVIKFER